MDLGLLIARTFIANSIRNVITTIGRQISFISSVSSVSQIGELNLQEQWSSWLKLGPDRGVQQSYGTYRRAVEGEISPETIVEILKSNKQEWFQVLIGGAYGLIVLSIKITFSFGATFSRIATVFHFSAFSFSQLLTFYNYIFVTKNVTKKILESHIKATGANATKVGSNTHRPSHTAS
ncbi:hypothetical protein BKA69DRAFT_1127387 [Paraphysoderma sedebokerense]|nr:hypothetical protein BKA69DRAFT_1127387 [Paraphysoderma sedebokerense]